MQQIAFDLQPPRQRARIGMQRAADAADRLHSEWSEHAYLFLREYARTHPIVVGEDVSDAHISAGLPQPGDLRAWASCYRRAVENGVLSFLDNNGWSRRRCSPTKRYASQIFGMTPNVEVQGRAAGFSAERPLQRRVGGAGQ